MPPFPCSLSIFVTGRLYSVAALFPLYPASGHKHQSRVDEVPAFSSGELQNSPLFWRLEVLLWYGDLSPLKVYSQIEGREKAVWFCLLVLTCMPGALGQKCLGVFFSKCPWSSKSPHERKIWEVMGNGACLLGCLVVAACSGEIVL